MQIRFRGYRRVVLSTIVRGMTFGTISAKTTLSSLPSCAGNTNVSCQPASNTAGGRIRLSASAGAVGDETRPTGRVCKGRKTWIKEHQRGDASLGFVLHDYSVERVTQH